jgi:toxin CptA
MHQAKFPLPLVVETFGSRQLRLFLITAHIAGVFALFLAALPPVFQWSGAVMLTTSLLLHLRPHSGFRLRGDEEGKLMLWGQGKWQPTRISNSSVVLPFCVVLRLTFANQRRYRNLVVLPDSLPATDFRRLRVWLRWRLKHETSVPADAGEQHSQ